ncbi:hypothetical protein C0993_005827 [Termitomyces sp. T159_Od127]|nr:hypothetical protein C0993_005827 [Termitomyces sp. T159_Od127]
MLVIGRSRRSLIGPPVGGAIFARFGYRGPFILGITWTIVDLIARLLIIERNEALQYGIDAQHVDRCEEQVKGNSDNQDFAISDQFTVEEPLETNPTTKSDVPPSSCPEIDRQRKSSHTSLVIILLKLTKSSRALIAFFLTFTYGFV